MFERQRVTVCHLEVESAWEINSEYVFTSSWHELCAPRTVCGHYCSWSCFFSFSAPSRMHHGWFLVYGTPSSHPPVLCTHIGLSSGFSPQKAETSQFKTSTHVCACSLFGKWKTCVLVKDRRHARHTADKITWSELWSLENGKQSHPSESQKT